MTNHKDCRNAKTADEYLLKCLFKAEDERDEAVAYCEGVRKAEEERIARAEEAQAELLRKLEDAPVFSVEETETVLYQVSRAYRYRDKDYGLNDPSVLRDALALDDEAFYTWSCKTYRGPDGWYSTKPIERVEKTYDYVLKVDCDGMAYRYVSTIGDPSSFEEVVDSAVTGYVLDIELDDEAKKLAIAEAREEIGKALEYLEKDAE
jgi:hypothetical protein